MKSNTEIILLFIFLSLAFLLERKPLNLILNFVGILISLAFIISNEYPEAQYFSFILIIVYTSALSILFGFIIMLNPNNLTNKIDQKLKEENEEYKILNNKKTLSYSNLNIKTQYRQLIEDISLKINKLFSIFNINPENKKNSILQDGEKGRRKELLINKLYLYFYSSRHKLLLGRLNKNILKYIFIILIFILSLWISNIHLFNYNIFINSFSTNILYIKELFFNLFYSSILNEYKIINNSSYPFFYWDKLNIEIIEKTGRNIYSCPNTIINLIIATLILLLALISLFFLISI